jgi:hypothetical protein
VGAVTVHGIAGGCLLPFRGSVPLLTDPTRRWRSVLPTRSSVAVSPQRSGCRICALVIEDDCSPLWPASAVDSPRYPIARLLGGDRSRGATPWRLSPHARLRCSVGPPRAATRPAPRDHVLTCWAPSPIVQPALLEPTPRRSHVVTGRPRGEPGIGGARRRSSSPLQSLPGIGGPSPAADPLWLHGPLLEVTDNSRESLTVRDGCSGVPSQRRLTFPSGWRSAPVADGFAVRRSYVFEFVYTRRLVPVACIGTRLFGRAPVVGRLATAGTGRSRLTVCGRSSTGE